MPAALPPQAEKLKDKGNNAFAEGRYEDAVALYTSALEYAPKSGVLFANRSFAYFKKIQDTSNTPLEERNTLRPLCLLDACAAKEYEPMYVKGYLRFADAMTLGMDEEFASVSYRESARKTIISNTYDVVIVALRDALKVASDESMRHGIEKRLAEWISKGKP